MGLFKRIAPVAGLSLGAFLVLKAWKRTRETGFAAFARGEGSPGNTTQVRNAGPEAMRDPCDGPWTEADEDSDESFPASDPPGNY